MSGETRELVEKQRAEGHFFYCNKCGAAYEGPAGKYEHPNCSYHASESPRDIQAQRLAAVVEILLEAHPERPCAYDWSDPANTAKSCLEFVAAQRNKGHFESRGMCQPCRDRALLERCDRQARGEA